jgi:hypothetical protein
VYKHHRLYTLLAILIAQDVITSVYLSVLFAVESLQQIEKEK